MLGTDGWGQGDHQANRTPVVASGDVTRMATSVQRDPEPRREISTQRYESPKGPLEFPTAITYGKT
jgi:hypothetical protein